MSTTQLFNTILEVAGAASSDEITGSLRQAKEFQHLSEEKRECVFAQGYPLEWALRRLKKGRSEDEGKALPHFAVYEDKFKLISAGDRLSLFDLTADSEENMDLLVQFPDVAIRLEKSLDRFLSANVPVAQNTTLDYEDSVIVEHLRALGYLE